MRPFVFVLFTGCSVHIPLEYMEPAGFTAPPEVQRLALVDRNPSEHSFKVLYTLRDELASGPRFELVSNEAAQGAYTATGSLVGQPLTADAAKAICDNTTATGIVSLKSLSLTNETTVDSHDEERTEVQRQRKSDGTEEEVEVTKMVTMYTYTHTTKGTSQWDLLNCNGESLDQHTVETDVERITSSEQAPSGTSGNFISTNTHQYQELEDEVLGRLGRTYSARISPWNAQVARRLYRGGNSDIRSGRKAAIAGDWNAAYESWKKAAKKGNADSPKAWLNLAVHHEQKGNLKVALKYAKRASKALGKPWVHAYVANLEERIQKKIQLGQQLGPDSD
ncbi:MAG: DUF6340 family protein [Myxococcota bacterium]